jgi:hypothetical protein
MRLMTPKPTAGNVLEVSLSIKDPRTAATDTAVATATSYDTLVCAVVYNGDTVFDFYKWECKDLYGTAAQLPYALSGNFGGAGITARKDTTNDWKINHDLSPNTCTEVMCEWIVTAYRPLETADTAADIPMTAGDSYYATGGFR